MDIPANFPYMYAFRAGRPKHDQDDFSRRHPKMPRGHRAKIFAPFAALDGFGGAVLTKNTVYVPPVELSEDEKTVLDQRLRVLAEKTSTGALARKNRMEVTVTYYVPCKDPYHDAYGVGGTYESVTGICWRVDDVFKTILVGDTRIQFDCIRTIEGKSFEEDDLWCLC